MARRTNYDIVDGGENPESTLDKSCCDRTRSTELIDRIGCADLVARILRSIVQGLNPVEPPCV